VRFYPANRGKRSGREPYLVDVSPIRDTAYEIDRDFKGAFLTVIDPDQRLTLSLEGLKQLYQLTAAETAVAELLFRGHTNEEISDLRRVSLETVKAQVRALLAKTGSRNRTELVSRLLSVTLPIE
jgi:DNA-binding NarL/FixJ family response regulator